MEVLVGTDEIGIPLTIPVVFVAAVVRVEEDRLLSRREFLRTILLLVVVVFVIF